MILSIVVLSDIKYSPHVLKLASSTCCLDIVKIMLRSNSEAELKNYSDFNEVYEKVDNNDYYNNILYAITKNEIRVGPSIRLSVGLIMSTTREA